MRLEYTKCQVRELPSSRVYIPNIFNPPFAKPRVYNSVKTEATVPQNRVYGIVDILQNSIVEIIPSKNYAIEIGRNGFDDFEFEIVSSKRVETILSKLWVAKPNYAVETGNRSETIPIFQFRKYYGVPCSREQSIFRFGIPVQ